MTKTTKTNRAPSDGTNDLGTATPRKGADSPEDVVDRLSEAHGQGQEQALADVARWLGCGPTVGEVEARCKALRPVEYRPGLPSAEVAEWHFKANKPGRWQRRYIHSRDGVMQMLMMQADEGGLFLWQQSGRMERPTEDDGFYEYRPCLPDGTPCPWPECP